MIKYAVYFVFFTYSTLSYAQDNKLSVLHWWVSPAEDRALRVILDEAERRGIVLEILPQNNYRALREHLVDLMYIGQKPDFSQWLASEDLSTFAVGYSSGVHWPEILEKIQPQLFPLVTYEGRIAAIPIVSHMQNSMFYNGEILARNGIAEPQTWADVEASWEVLAQNGVQPVLTSDETWQLRMVFGDILIGIGGIDAHNQLFSMSYSPELENTLTSSFKTLAKIRDYQDDVSQNLNWADAAANFANGEIGYFFLGDFAWAEMAYTDSAKHIICQPVPAEEKTLIYGTDILLVFPSGDEMHEKAQREFAETILDRKVQEDFVFEKGGMPVIKDIDIDALAPCALSAMTMLQDPSAIIRNTPWADSRIALFHLEAQIERFWADKTVSPERASADLLQALELVE